MNRARGLYQTCLLLFVFRYNNVQQHSISMQEIFCFAKVEICDSKIHSELEGYGLTCFRLALIKFNKYFAFNLLVVQIYTVTWEKKRVLLQVWTLVLPTLLLKEVAVAEAVGHVVLFWWTYLFFSLSRVHSSKPCGGLSADRGGGWGDVALLICACKWDAIKSILLCSSILAEDDILQCVDV